ncbi:MAG: DUF362 domain-containing protein [Deltaproteobacteria bacterium]|nr:DUF362 domain-containing protein [Deltaproteobacteria bacterium]
MNQPSQQPVTSRRDFLLRLLKGGISIGAACSLSYWLYDSTGPGIARSENELVTLPDFSMSSPKGKMSIVTGLDRVKTINRGLEALGGIEAFVKQGDRVLLKVNAAFATPPILSATTNPQLLAEVTRLCYKAGASTVVVTDNPINDPSSCFSLSGIKAAAQSAGANVLLPRDRFFRPTTVSAGVLIQNWPILWEPFQGTNKVIGIAPVKDHHRSGASMSMKNWYGLLGGRRNIFHQDINTIITELAMMVKPTLVILDGTTAMMTNGPTGGSLSDLKQTNTMIVSTDQVAADAFGAALLGKTVAELPYIAKAEAAGLGTADYEALSPIRLNSA